MQKLGVFQFWFWHYDIMKNIYSIFKKAIYGEGYASVYVKSGLQRFMLGDIEST